MNIAIGTGRAYVYAFVDTKIHRVGVRLTISEPDRLAYFHLLEDQKETIEQEIGSELVWDELPDKKTSYICLYKLKSNPKQKNNWPEQQKFLLEALEAFHKAFATRVKNLDAGDYQQSNGK